MALLHADNINAVPRKPIESGCRRAGDELVPQDACRYYEAAQRKFALSEVCPFRFEPAISPQRAARLARQPAYTEEVYAKCIQGTGRDDFLVVEGAGGFYSPLCEDGMNSSLAQRLGLPVLLVADDKLGCINHVLLTVEAIHSHGLSVCAVILSQRRASETPAMNNGEDLGPLLEAPVFTLSHQETLQKAERKAVLILQAIESH